MSPRKNKTRVTKTWNTENNFQSKQKEKCWKFEKQFGNTSNSTKDFSFKFSKLFQDQTHPNSSCTILNFPNWVWNSSGPSSAFHVKRNKQNKNTKIQKFVIRIHTCQKICEHVQCHVFFAISEESTESHFMFLFELSFKKMLLFASCDCFTLCNTRSWN